MKLADTSIERPVFAAMMILALLVLGMFSYLKLNIDFFPDVDFPFVVVTTVLPGAGPEQIETDVTKPIEEAVNTIGGLQHLQSISQEGVSIVVLQFKLEVQGPQAAQDVREKIAGIRANLPTDIEEPVIQRLDPASEPIFTLTVSGPRSEKDITTYVKDVVIKRLENVQGVGRVDLVGGSEREVQVDVDAERLKAYGLSIQDVIQGVSSSNVEIPAGNLIQGRRQLLLRTMGKYTKIDDFNNVIVATPNDRVVHLSDVAGVVDGVKEKTSLARVNGQNAVSLNILRQSGSNTVRVADAVDVQLAQLQRELPRDLHLIVVRDDSTYIRNSVQDVLFNIIYGGLLAVVVVFLFLANSRATIISALALPTSIIASFIVMYALKFTLNMMSLLALSLAVGLLIDDAIVVIENIFRHMRQGETPLEAAKAASNEIGLAVMATTFTIVAVFVPVAFMPGIVGRVFYQFGITVSVSVLVSLFVAFTLTPMLSSRWLKREGETLSKKGNPLQKLLYYFNHAFTVLSEKYRVAIRWSLGHRKTIVFGALGVFAFSFFLMRFLGTSFFPSLDRNEFNVGVTAAPGSSLEQTSTVCAAIERVVGKLPETTMTFTTIGAGTDPVTAGNVYVKLVDRKKRKRDVFEIADQVRSVLRDLPGANLSYSVAEITGGGDKPVTMSVRGDNMTTLENLADKVEQIVRATPGTVDIDNSLEKSKPEVRIHIDRERASDLGVNVGLVASTARAMVDGYVASQYQEGDERFDVRVRLNKEDRTSLENVNDLTVVSSKSSPDGSSLLVPISYVAQIDQGIGPSRIYRYDRQREIRISANLSDRLLGPVLGDITSRTRDLDIPPGYSVKVAGEGEFQAESFRDIFMALILAIIFVYIVLAAQFDSFRYPLAIMLALPMSLIGAVFALLIVRGSLSVMSLIGIIMLMGLVTKNGILLVDYTNVLRDRGLERTDALVTAGATRLRPILMTTFAMIFGMIPVAFAFGEGSEFRAPMGQAVIGGLITSTFLTLFVVPVVYSILEDISIRRIAGFGPRLIRRLAGRPGGGAQDRRSDWQARERDADCRAGKRPTG